MKKKNYKPKLGNIDLFNCSDKELIRFGHQSINHHISDIVAPEMMRRLKISIDRFNEQSSKQTERLVKLTKGIIGLTIAMLIGLGIQIFLLVYSMFK